MITRIVRMEFKPENTSRFQEIFNQSCQAIRAMPGCLYLSLHTQADNPAVFYTISKWNHPDDLENYRQSELFKSTWANTKVLFAHKPGAWTLNPEAELI
jgi:autoinducer 2-degrading protein